MCDFFEAPAGGGFEAKGCGPEGVKQTIKPDTTVQLSVSCFNMGSRDWPVGEVLLGACCPLGSASALIAWRDSWLSDRYYAQMTTSVAAGSNGTAVFNVHAPKDAVPGDYHFDGILTLKSTGAPIAGGAFSIVVAVAR